MAFELGGVFLTVVDPTLLLVVWVWEIGVLEGANLLYNVLLIFLRCCVR